jgi:alkanesulfonate monooxygenase SsuD/methylene tetrahydromethanopterin reductase-like flavin-dependent oxidoreductase (luciferase family)
MVDVHLGISLWPEAATWQEMLQATREVEHFGYESLWASDHLYPILGTLDQPVYEGWAILTAWAMATERIRLGLLVGANTFRNPGLFAKMAVTVDHISGGRMILGIGGSWFEPEHSAYGIDFGKGFGQRLDWLDEAVAAIRVLVDGGEVTSAPGDHYKFDHLRLCPSPLQSRLPLMIGGSGERKTLRTVAKYADQWNAQGTADILARKDAVLREHCAAEGRDHHEILRTVGCMMVIRDTPLAARQAWAEIMRHNHHPPERWHGPDFAWVGTPAQIAHEIAERVDVGFSTFLVQLPAPYDVQTMERLMGEVKPMLTAGN